MRIILFLAAAAGAAAMSAPALAQSAATTAGHRGPSYPAASMRAGGHSDWHPHPRFPGGRFRGPGRPHDRDRWRHHRRFGRDSGEFVYPFGFAGGFDMVDPHGNGFFAGAGGEIRMSGGRPHYNYDRSYPYEWASAAAGPAGWGGAEDGRRPIMLCGIEQGVRVCRGRR